MNLRALYHNLFNVKFALISALCNGAIALYVNRGHGIDAAWYAGSAQAIASFFSTGVTARIVQHFSPIENPLRSYFWGSLIPAGLTFLLSVLAHTVNGTPELLRSCIAPTLISFTTSHVTNFITRRGHMLPGNYCRRTAP